LELLGMVAVAWPAATGRIVPEVIERTEVVEVETVVAESDPEGIRLALEAVRMGSSLELGLVWGVAEAELYTAAGLRNLGQMLELVLVASRTWWAPTLTTFSLSSIIYP
jgi:hypothetical protein